jgi:hypothetical protein
MSFDLMVTQPEFTTYPLVTEPTLGGPHLQVQTRVSIGTAEPYPITTSRVTNDPELASALERSQRHDYYGVYLVCSFLEAASETVEHATFSVALSYADPAEHDQPIAWSLWPLKLTTKPVHQTRNAKARIGIKVGADLGLEGGYEEEVDVEQCYVVAAGEREPDPEWRFRRTATATLDGSHDLWLVAQVGRGREAVAAYGLAATVRRPRFGISHARLEVPVQQRIVHLRQTET